MRPSTYKEKLEKLQKGGWITAAEARAAGIPARMLSHFCERGDIERICRGVYKRNCLETGLEMSLEDLILTAQSIPRGIICLLSALQVYEMTDQIAREYWIAVPNSDRSPKRPHVRTVRMRNTTLGATTVEIGGYAVRIFDRERTIVDAFRFLSDEIALKALQIYLKSQHPKADLGKLSAYAKDMKMHLTPYILALTT